MVKSYANSYFKGKEAFPLKTSKRRDWMNICKLPATEPIKTNINTWNNIIPSSAYFLAEVIEEIIGSAHPYEHQEQAINHLLRTTNRQKKPDLIINGGTFSGKSLSFIVPGIVKLLNEETDFIVVFYPSKQLLLDQYERVKKYLVSLSDKTGKKLTCKEYSGDTGKTSNSQAAKQELVATEQDPPNILLATFDKVWYQLITGSKNPLLDKIMNAQYLVFDEIHAFDGYAAAIIKGFINVHKKVNPKSQFVLSSATIDNLEGFRNDFLPSAKTIVCPPVRGEQLFLGTTIEHTIPMLAELWKELEEKPGKVGLVFVDSKEDIEFLTDRLCEKLKNEYPFFDEDTVEMIHADLPYHHRKKILDEIRKDAKNKIRILISSSVLELGVNIPNIQTVINIGIPITKKDGIVQRFARNRSVPGEKRTNVFVFDLAKKRDNFYWNNKDILEGILETNACNPILYAKQNPKILAGQIILHLRYGITDFAEIMQFFLDQGTQVYRLARLQYTKLVSLMVLKKGADGKLLFTSQGEKKLTVQAKKKNPLVPFSIRAIKKNWSIKKRIGANSDSGWHEEESTSLGRISSRDVLRKGLPDNIIPRNKEQYLVTDFDDQLKTIYVKKLLTEEKSIYYNPNLTNRLFDPQITLGVFSKKAKGTKLADINYGQVTIKQQTQAIVNANPKAMRTDRKNTDQSFFWQELTPKQSEEFAVTDRSDGIIIGLKSDLQKPKELSTKKILEYLGKVLQVEIENVLSIPASEFALTFNNNQLVLSDKGDPNGNSDYLFNHLRKVATKTLERLTNCLCEAGCKNCYGEILGLFPAGLKECLRIIVKDLTLISDVSIEEELLEDIPSEQLNFKENRIFAFSDIHLTNKLCFEEEFFEALSNKSKQADIIIINGDLLDTISEAGYGAFNTLKLKALKEGFWSKMVFIRSSSIHDGNLEEFSGFLHQDNVELEINSEHVLFVHGNKIGLNPSIAKSVSIEKAVIEAKRELVKKGRSWLPDVFAETHFVVGHLHNRFYHERFRVYGLGHWLNKGASYHQKCFMLIDPTNKIDTIQLHTHHCSI